MLKLLIAFFFIGLTISAAISKIESTQLIHVNPYSNNIGFADNIGPDVTTAQINTFKKAVLQAANLYGDDMQRNLMYISTYMNNFEPDIYTFYIVFIQASATISNYKLFFAPTNYGSFKNLNPSNPSWTYLFGRSNHYSQKNYFYIYSIGQGQGLSSNEVAFIIQTIKQKEPVDRICDCSQTNWIQNKLMNYYNMDGNVLCDNSKDINAYITADKKKWIYIQPQNICYYLIFII